MNPSYNVPPGNPRHFMPTYNQHPHVTAYSNSSSMHGEPGVNKSYPHGYRMPEMPQNVPLSQNGIMNDSFAPSQNLSQVQCPPVPPPSQVVNSQLSQDMNSMRLSPNQNQPLITSNQHLLTSNQPLLTSNQPPSQNSMHPEQPPVSYHQQYYRWPQPLRPPQHPSSMHNNVPVQNNSYSSARMSPAPNRTVEPPPNQANRIDGYSDHNQYKAGAPLQPPYSNASGFSAPPSQYPNTNMQARYPPSMSPGGMQNSGPPSLNSSDLPAPPSQYPNSTMQARYPPSMSPGGVQNSGPPSSGSSDFTAPSSQYQNSSMQARYPPSMPPGGMQNSGPPSSGLSYSQSAGTAPMGNTLGTVSQPPAQNRRLNPDNMPSPIQVIEDDRKQRSGPFSTGQRGLVPPLVTTKFTVIDEGLCSPRFIRSSIYSVPTTAQILTQTAVPFALAISPFARIEEDESPPPLVDPGEEGPVRCHRCRAYMSPFMQFTDAGRRFQCMLCKTTSEVPMHYFSHLDHMGERADRLERPELCLGSYEFIVNKDYCKEGKYPNCPAFIFLIDVSYNAIRSGMVNCLCDNMKSLLSSLPREYNLDQFVRVGFITYSSVVHFYNINGNLGQPQMLVVSDVQDMFMPLLDGFLVHVSQSEQVIDSLLEQIPLMFADNKETETLLGPAIQAGLEALKAAECAGKLFVFHTSLPLAEAPGKLKNRNDIKLLGTDKEKTLLSPQSSFYNNLGQECVKAGCCVDMYLFNNAYVDAATIGQVCRLTGGQMYKYTYFQADSDGERFITDLRNDIAKPIAFDAVLRVRTSTGIRPTDFHGCFFMSNTTDVELAAVTCDSSVSVEIHYDDKLCEDEGVLVQVAMLYTSCSGQRRLRVHNLALNSCTQMADLFRNCELDAIMNFFLKDGARRITEENPKQVKERFAQRSAQMLACYRKHCAQTSSAGQLILPECVKLLPLYINCLIKCEALAGGQEISTDERSYLLLSVLSMNVQSSVAYLYPRLLPLHHIQPSSPDEPVVLPTSMRCSIERLKDNGVYLIENGLVMFLWVGLNADPEWVRDVFGLSLATASRTEIENIHLPKLATPLSQYIHSIINQVQSERSRCMRLYVVRPGDKLELLFRLLLVEDRTTEGSEAYVDFLCHLHKEIRSLLS